MRIAILALFSAMLNFTAAESRRDGLYTPQKYLSLANQNPEIYNRDFDLKKWELLVEPAAVLTDWARDQLWQAEIKCCRSLVHGVGGEIRCDLSIPRRKGAKNCPEDNPGIKEKIELQSQEEESEIVAQQFFAPFGSVFNFSPCFGVAGLPGFPVFNSAGFLNPFFNLSLLNGAGLVDAFGVPIGINPFFAGDNCFNGFNCFNNFGNCFNFATGFGTFGGFGFTGFGFPGFFG